MSDARPTPAEAWARLEAGNQNWANGQLYHPDQDSARRAAVAMRQDPFATVVCCIDSRVPAELVFDQGIGTLFAVRTGAHAMDDVAAASTEYGPLVNGTPLIVVMGHKRCGAVTAAVNAIRGGERLPGHLDALVERLRPAFHAATGAKWATERSVVADGEAAEAELIDRVVRAQIVRTVRSLAFGPLEELVLRGALGIVGVYYDLDSGLVSRLESVGM
jgi:carbonic anhydrase